MDFSIKTIQKSDYSQIDHVVKSAFEQSELGYNGEVEIVHSLRQLSDYDSNLEIGAYHNNQLIGMGLLSSGYIETDSQTLNGLILAPVAVDPQYQNQGIGKQLILELEQRATNINAAFIHLVGHPNYYQKLGYQPITNWNLTSVLDGPADVFMIKEITDHPLKEITGGQIHYNEVFEPKK